jgi:hypothetical protein
MGHNAEIYLFDYTKYTTEVAPAFRDLLNGDTSSPLLQEVMTTPGLHRYPLPVPTKIDIQKYCTYLGLDLELRQEFIFQDSYENPLRQCHSSTCEILSSCLFHAKYPDPNSVELINVLYITTVSRYCLGEGQYVGRSNNPSSFNRVLKDKNLLTPRLFALLEYLDLRGIVLGWGWSNSDGVKGWLNPTETQKLFNLLSRIPLPTYESSFDRMRMFLKTNSDGSKTYQHPSASRDELFLSFLRTVSQIAGEQQKGILWGNDISRK